MDYVGARLARSRPSQRHVRLVITAMFTVAIWGMTIFAALFPESLVP